MENLFLLQSKEMFEHQIAHLTSENQRLKAEKNQIHEEKTTLQSQLSHLQNQNTDLQQQIEKLQTEKQHIEEELFSKVEDLERMNEESVTEVRKLRRDRDELLAEKEERERRFHSAAEDTTEVVLSLLVAQTDLEERMERTQSAAEKGRKKRYLFVIKDAADFFKRLVGRQGSGRRV